MVFLWFSDGFPPFPSGFPYGSNTEESMVVEDAEDRTLGAIINGASAPRFFRDRATLHCATGETSMGKILVMTNSLLWKTR